MSAIERVVEEIKEKLHISSEETREPEIRTVIEEPRVVEKVIGTKPCLKTSLSREGDYCRAPTRCGN
jgi:hypothetical protein